MLYDLIRQDLKDFMKLKDMEMVNAIRVIIGEFPRLNKLAGELPTDNEVVKILKTLKKNEEIALEAQKQTNSTFLTVVSGYLPQLMSKDEIKIYIESSDVELEGNLGQAMSQLMKELKGKADGGVVREVLTEMSKG